MHLYSSTLNFRLTSPQMSLFEEKFRKESRTTTSGNSMPPPPLFKLRKPLLNPLAKTSFSWT